MAEARYEERVYTRSERADYGRSIPGILSTLIGQFTTLVRQESELARTELSEKIGSAMMGIAMAVGSVVLLLSADHFYRASPLVNGVRDHRVPFLVHFPGEKSGVQYAASFNTVLTYGLIEAVLHSQLTSAASAGDWLDQNAYPKFDKLR